MTKYSRSLLALTMPLLIKLFCLDARSGAIQRFVYIHADQVMIEL